MYNFSHFINIVFNIASLGVIKPGDFTEDEQLAIALHKLLKLNETDTGEPSLEMINYLLKIAGIVQSEMMNPAFLEGTETSGNC
ncbi:MAG: hypothetical protein V2I97_15965 [Desulfococcaceae bacterium]|jgi:hypothetical protein|nr:hypothetical protein [Desulfococcaceae bacterium]